MKNYKITSIQLIKYQQLLDKVYGKGRFIAGCIFLLLGLSFLTSCAEDIPPGTQERTPQERRTNPTPPVAITIEDTTQENVFSENPLSKTTYPIVFDAYFAEERDGSFHRIERAYMKDTVYIVVDTLNLAGRTIEVRLLDNKDIITGVIPFQQYRNINTDSTLEENFSETSTNVNGIFTGTVRNIDRGENGVDRRHAIFKIEFKATNDATTNTWITDLREDEDREMDLYIRVNVLDVNDVVYCGSNEEEEDRRESDPDCNVWLNMEGNYFKLKYCRCCEYTIDTLGYMTGDNITQHAVEACNNTAMTDDVAIIVLHRTAGGPADGLLSYMGDEGYGAHFIVDNASNTDGEIYHAISLNNRGSHMGVGQYQTTKNANWGNHNSIGIEVCGYSYDSNGNIKDLNNDNPHDHWQDVTNEQAHSTACLVKFLLRHFSLSKGDIKVHEDLCSKTEGEGQTVYDAMMNYWH